MKTVRPPRVAIPARRRFSEREVIETLHCCGIDVLCYRCHKKLEPGQKIQREHITEIALGGADSPENCAYSHAECHAIVTDGTPATSAGSSKQRIAKVKRSGKMAVDKPPPGKRKSKSKKHPWVLRKRKMQSRPFPKAKRKFATAARAG